jgi:hypothetical protein
VVETTFTLSEEEYIEAQRLYIQSTNPGLKWQLRLVGGIILLSFAFVFMTNLHQLSTLLSAKLILPGSLLAILLLSPWLQVRAFRKRYRVEMPGLTNVHIRIDEIGYHSTVSGQGKGEIPWGAFTSFGETPTVLALFKGYAFYAIPKRTLDEDELSQVEQLVRSRLPKLNRKLAKSQGR